jgi:hypothetical protein
MGMGEETLKETCDRLRGALKAVELEARALVAGPMGTVPTSSEAFEGQFAEMRAQAKLSVRDIEAARMRLGKVLQYAGDGVSIYDKV